MNQALPVRGMIVAMAADRAIGQNGTLPWHYSADLKRFKRLTMGATIIMGRNTWNSLPRKPLPGRRNIVITRSRIDAVTCFTSIEDALNAVAGDVWFIGGARIYEEAFAHCNTIDVMHVPDTVTGGKIVYFPAIDDSIWEASDATVFADDVRLTHRVFTRRCNPEVS